MAELEGLPPRCEGGIKASDGVRRFTTEMGTRDYLRLEVEAMERGLKPFSLTKLIMTAYVNRKLIVLSDLPIDIQKQVTAYYQTRLSAQV